MSEESSREPIDVPIAIIGMSCLYPGSSDLVGFWEDVLAGRDRLTRVPADRWLVEDYYDPDPKAPDKIYVDRGGFLDAVDFDPLHWGVPPSIVPSTDSTQLLALMVAERVLRDAFGDAALEDRIPRDRTHGASDGFDRDRTSVILGVTGAQKLLGEMNSRLQRPVWVKALREMGLSEDRVQEACDRIAASYVPWQESTFPGVLGNVVAGRIANRLNLGGTNCVTDAACASTFSALKMAVDELQLRHSDVVVCGGADTMNDPFMFECFAKTTALSPSGDCRPFSARADGTMLGEGVGMVALARLPDAERAGWRIYALIRGVGSSSDGRAKSVYAPLPVGQAKAIRRAYERAGYGPETVELIEAHGTGTAAGDAAELEGLSMVFGESGRGDAGWCAVGSVKSQIGHTKAAAGAAGLIKAVLAVQHGVFPPTLKIDRPHPALDLDGGPFYLSTETRPWIRGADHPRRAGISSFGFGGSNFHVAVEEYRGSSAALRLPIGGPELFTWSAPDAESLAARIRDLLRRLVTASDAGAPDRSPLPPARASEAGVCRWLAYDSQRSFDAGAPARLALVANDEADLTAKLELALPFVTRGEAFRAPGGVELAFGEPDLGPVAFLFPGQGSQYRSMGGPLAIRFARARAAWDRAAELELGDSPAEVVFPPPTFDPDVRAAQEADLRATQNAQPALGLTSIAMLEVLRALGLHPAAVAGHSFGEAVALHAAGALSEADLLRIARRRGELMALAAGEVDGAMLAVSASIEVVRELIDEWGFALSVANHNHPTQVVLSGATAVVAEAERRLEERGLRGQRLPVDTAFHSPLVSAASEPFRAFLDEVEVGDLAVPVYANATASPYEPTRVRAMLSRQIAEPVRFMEQIEAMYDAGVRTFVEVGAGSVLTGLVSRILKGRPHRAIALDRKNAQDLSAFFGGLARLAAAGARLSLEALFEGERPPVDPASLPARRMTLKLTGANYGKPYPPPGGSASLPQPNLRSAAPPATDDGALASTPERASAPVLGGEDGAETAARGPGSSDGGTRTTMGLRPGAGGEMSRDQQHGGSDDALRALLEMQRQTAEVHASFQQAMSEAHAAFLRSTESGLEALAALAGAPGSSASRFEAVEAAAVMRPEGADDRFAAAGVRRPAEPSLSAPVVKVTDPTSSLGARPVEAVTPTTATDLNALLLEVVADKTGYPVDMLDPTMELETDLGVDSIKRVEILSALRERAPELPELDPARLGSLRTLDEIARVLGDEGPSVGGVAVAPPEPTSPSDPPERAPLAVDLTALMLEIVGEKTGYPADMLDPSMELESDLGVDSIKRVEILSALRERAPGLPELDPAHLGKLRTLAEIAAVLGAGVAERPVEAGAPPPGERDASTSEATSDASGARSRVLAKVAAAPRSEEPIRRELGVSAAGVPSRFVVSAREVPAPGLAAPGLFDTPLTIVDGGSGMADAMAAALEVRGIRASVADEVPADAGALVILSGLAEGRQAAAAAFEAVCTVAPAFAERGGLLFTVQDTGGEFGSARSDGVASWERAALSGLAKTAALEWPTATVRSLDIDAAGRSADEVAARIARELIEGGISPEVGLTRDGRRIVPEVVAAPVPPTRERAGSPVVVASGGARGVTAACLIALAQQVGGRYLLLGRTPSVDEPDATRDVPNENLERVIAEAAKANGEEITLREARARARAIRAGREVRATLRAIEAAGADARYESVDIRDAAALGEVLARVRRDFGAFDTLVHGAGVLADRLLTDKAPEDFERVFSTKVDGLRALLEATAEDRLSSIVLFSSVAARYGNPGQSDYAMANSVLDAAAVSLAAERPEARVSALAWGPWDGGMVTPELAAHFAERGVSLIDQTSGAEAFVREALARPDDRPNVVLGPVLAPRTEGERRFHLRVSRGSHPYLADHAVEDVPVLPVVVVLDLFGRAARGLRPDLEVTCCRELKVLRGVPLQRFEQGERFEVALRLLSNGQGATYAAELRSGRGVHYRAQIDLREELPVPSRVRPDPEGLVERAGPLYGGCLFHGRRFQVIQRLDGVGDAGAAGVLIGTAEIGWGGDGWVLDPALLDGALQLAVLWTERRLGGAALPTGLDTLNVFQAGPIEGEVRAIVHGQRTVSGRALSDVSLVDEDGQMVAELRGVETHVRPGSVRELQAR